jgi:post-segregation antitoxin (ccd killing protein)
MTTLEIKVTLPDELAREAQAAGLLTDEAIERMIKAELKHRAGEALLESARRISAVEGPVMTPEEIQQEINAVRAERRARRS